MPKSRAQREAEFRAKHGVSSGTYYEMRRKAAKGGITGQAFDKMARAGLPGYKTAKNLVQLKRAAGAAKDKGIPTKPFVDAIEDAIEDLPPDIEITWGTP